MNFPVGPEDVKIVHGRIAGLQVICTCGCVNFNYLDPQDTLWKCRNCRQVLSNDFPRLLERAMALEKQATAEAAAAAPPKSS
ncbi:MAG: hypothetical protein ABSA41_03590 [Terriglobia bacterium]|jgi:hypothetical protein